MPRIKEDKSRRPKAEGQNVSTDAPHLAFCILAFALINRRVNRASSHSGSPAPRAPASPSVRRPFRDNPRLILAFMGVLVAALVVILVVAERTSRLSPDFLTEVVLYALSATNAMMLLALVFILARNIVKLLVERRRAIPFVRFRAKLVFVLLG